mgnify:CR=1 FL=1
MHSCQQVWPCCITCLCSACVAGSAALLDNMPREDAFVLRKLKQAGALTLGKANMGEFALFPSFTVGSLFGVVRNPYHLHHTPAGVAQPGAAVARWAACKCSIISSTDAPSMPQWLTLRGDHCQGSSKDRGRCAVGNLG